MTQRNTDDVQAVVPGISFSAKDIQGFRAALEKDFGGPVPFSDEEIRDRSRDMLYLIQTIRRIEGNQKRRRALKTAPQVQEEISGLPASKWQ